MGVSELSPRTRQGGLSIIEIMITLTLGLFIIGGILYTYLGSRTVYQSNDAIAKIQDSGRMAMERLTREIRQSGFMGCSNSLSVTANVIADPDGNGDSAEHVVFAPGDAIIVFDNGTGWVNPTAIARIAGTDVIQVKGLSTCTAKLTGNMTGIDQPVPIGNNPCGWAPGQILVMADCTNVDIFAATKVSGAAGSITIMHGSTKNTDANLSKAYGKESMVFGYGEKTFFLGMHPTLNQPMLYEVSYDGVNVVPQDLVADVYDMQVPSVVTDTNGDSTPDATVLLASVTDWGQVIGMQVHFSVRSEFDNVAPTSLTYTFNGAATTDRRIKRDFTSLIGIRNRLP